MKGPAPGQLPFRGADALGVLMAIASDNPTPPNQINASMSDEVTVSMDDGKKKAKSKLLMRFTADKDKSTGRLDLVVDTAKVGRDRGFELAEMDGKRQVS